MCLHVCAIMSAKKQLDVRFSDGGDPKCRLIGWCQMKKSFIKEGNLVHKESQDLQTYTQRAMKREDRNSNQKKIRGNKVIMEMETPGNTAITNWENLELEAKPNTMYMTQESIKNQTGCQVCCVAGRVGLTIRDKRLTKRDSFIAVRNNELGSSRNN